MRLRQIGPLLGVALLLSLPLAAQTTFPLLINAGGPAIGAYGASSCINGTTWGPQMDPAMATMMDVYQTLVWGPTLTCTISVASSGLYSVSLLMLEPNKTGPGQRAFTVTVNGDTKGPLDLFALAGGKLIPYEVDYLLFEVERQITITFRASVGNAVVSAIIVRGSGQPVTAGIGMGGWPVAQLSMPGAPAMAALAIGACGTGTVDPATTTVFDAIICYDPPSQSAVVKYYDASGKLQSAPL